jgi:uncharacterized protein (DUF342 family)
MCLVIFASIVSSFFKLKIDIAKLNKDIEQLKRQNEMDKQALIDHKKDNRSELNNFIEQNNEAHNKIDVKLDKLIDLHLTNKI